MSEGSAKGFWMSVGLHGAVAVALFLGFVLKSEEPEAVKIFELVAGEGDNFMATEAPALGTPGGVKVEIPEPPTPKPSAPEPAPQEFTAPPVTPAPQPKKTEPKKETPPTKAPEPTVPNFKKQLVRDYIKGESRAKKDIAKERAAEKKRQEEEAKRISKEEFDRKNKAKAVASATPTKAGTKAPKVDAEGIAKGVSGGSTANKIGGAGGKALTAEEGNELERFKSALMTRLREALEKRAGSDDGLRAEAEFSITDSGRLVNGRITKSSGNDAFDKAVLDAIASVSMGYRAKGMDYTVSLPFSTYDRNRG